MNDPQHPARVTPGDEADEIRRDIAAIGRIDAVPALLKVICETTGMGFAAVARVTDGSWTACAVRDDIDFGLKPGGQLPLETTLCFESRAARQPVVIDHASQDPTYRDHHTPRLYNIQSYISVPIVLEGDEYFGNLCAIDPNPAEVSQPRILSLFKLFAELIALQLQNERRLETERAAMFDERATGELREQFIAILGHDLRNPLAAVMAGAHLLEKKSSDPNVVGLSQRIRTNARRMSGLIDDVLDFARGRMGGGFGAKLEPLSDVGGALNDVIAEFKDSHADRVIQSRIDVPHVVHGDRARLQQLTSNLLANALTHGSPGGVVTFAAHTDAQHLLIEVGNDGEPIPEEHLAQVFAPFWRRSTSDQREGLGLGLFICAQIVKAHHGQLSVTSTRAEGTRFEVRIPLGTAQVAQP
jgi:signal transduction histidine kinase